MTEDVTVGTVVDEVTTDPAPISIKRETKVRTIIYAHKKCGALDAVYSFENEEWTMFVNCWKCGDGFGVQHPVMHEQRIGMQAIQIDEDDGDGDYIFAKISVEGSITEQSARVASNAREKVRSMSRVKLLNEARVATPQGLGPRTVPGNGNKKGVH